MIEVLGWLGSTCLALCALPQVIQCVKQKHAKGVSFWFLLLWLLGEIFTMIYVFAQHGLDLPLTCNYLINILFIIIIIHYERITNE